MNPTVKETQQVLQFRDYYLSRQSCKVYQGFLNNLRDGNPIPGEQEVPNFANWYYCQLSSGEFVLYSVRRNQNWRGEIHEIINIESLIPKVIVDSITGGQLGAIFFQTLVSKINSLIDNAQRIIFNVEFLVKFLSIICTIVVAAFMFGFQFSKDSKMKPQESGLIMTPSKSKQH